METANLNKTLKKAGDVVIDYLTITGMNGISLNVLPQLVLMEISESIFEHYITGTITIEDSEDLTNFFPLMGNEIMDVQFHTPNLSEAHEAFIYQKSFFIYGSSDKIKTSNRSSIYKLDFISIEAVMDNASRISRTFRGTGDEIIQTIVKEELGSSKPIVVEKTKNSIVFISNYWHPSRAIDYLSDNSISNSGDSSSYVFFEDRSGFIWMTINTLVAQDDIITFYKNAYTPITTNSPYGTISKSMADDYLSVIDIEYHNAYDFFERSKNGFFGGEILSYDVNTHQYIHTRSGVNFENQNHLNKNSPAPANTPLLSSSFIVYRPYATQNFENQNEGIKDTNIPYKVGRQQTFAQLGTTKVNIRVHGKTDYSVGHVVNLFVEKDKQITKDDPNKFDTLISGRYLITSLTHQISKNRHYCNMELMKDSYIRSIDFSGYEYT